MFKFLKRSEQQSPIENSDFDAIEILILFANADGKIDNNEKENIVEFIKSEFPDKNATSLFDNLKVKSDNSISFNENINELNKKLNFEELSMGMSSDYLNAIQNCATYVRIGSNIFGQRN